MGITNVADSALSNAMSQSGGYSKAEQNMLNQLDGKDRSRMEAQLALQHEQEMVSFISNQLKKKNEIAMAVISNLK